MKRSTAVRQSVGALALAAIIGVTVLMAAMPAAAQCTTNANTNVTVDNAGPQQGSDAFKSDNLPPIQGSNWQAQTFTVTGEGCFLLNQVTVSVKKVGSPGNLVVEIYDVVPTDTPAFPQGLGGTATPLATAVVSAASVPTTYSDLTVTFSSPSQILGGTQYALVVHQTAGSGQNFYALGADDGTGFTSTAYSGGRFCKSTSTGWDCPAGPGGGIDVRMSICVSPCTIVTGCTLTQGYWKTHGGTGPQPNTWPVNTLFLGTVSYTQAQLLSILAENPGSGPGGANGLVSLAHQLIAAKLNIANGASAPPSVQAAISSADSLIGALVVPPVGGGFLATSATSALTATLDEYNNGLAPGGPPHCP